MAKPHTRNIKEESTARSSGQTPHVSLDFTLVPVGYQMDLYIDGKCMKIECRDFGGAPAVSRSAERLIHHLEKAIEDWRSSL